MDAPTLDQALHARAADILDRCTACGRCAEVCPMPGPAGLDTTNPQALTAGILTLLRGGTHAQASRW
ncbi:MAG: 4Fe-4S binding protein, partial [Acetobacteraceae bacterium]|nr:4Fe-4S binding protein [Acetobacteraceae bacterium]